MYIFYYKNMILGGAEFLLLNLAKELKKDEEVQILFESAADDILKEILKLGLTCNSRKFFRDIVRYIKSINCKNIKIIVFNFYEYIILKHQLKDKEVKVFYYSMHSQGFIYGKRIIWPLNKILKNKLTEIIQNGLLNGEVSFLNEGTISKTEAYYKVFFNPKYILGIPHEFGEIKIEDIRLKSVKKPLCIITAARAEFPFKGYIIGLIDEFYNLINKGFDINLIIVSMGADESSITEKLKGLPEEIKNRITFYNGLPQQDLLEITKECHLAVGMGTFMVDAASMGVISLAVKSYSMKCLTGKRFFYENLSIVADDNEAGSNFEEMITAVYNYSAEEFISKSMESYYAAEREFSVINIVNRLRDNISKQDKVVIDDFTYRIVLINYYRKKISRRIREMMRR